MNDVKQTHFQADTVHLNSLISSSVTNGIFMHMVLLCTNFVSTLCWRNLLGIWGCYQLSTVYQHKLNSFRATIGSWLDHNKRKLTMYNIWIKGQSPARLKDAAAGRSAPSILDVKLEKRLFVTRGPDQRFSLMNGPSW